MKNVLNRAYLLITLILITPPIAKAYDSDTHLRMTYSAARFVGINHEVSLMLAMSAQWNDVSALTTPMGSLVVGTRLRRLFHFPASRSVEIDNTGAHGSTNFNTVTKAYRLDPMGSELIIEGMRKGYLPFVGNGIHTLQETFGHEGYAAEIGHAYAGHEPDRPWRNWHKYKQMSLAVIRAMIGIRELLPEEALDFSTLKERGLWNDSTDRNNAEQLTKIFLKKIEPVANNDIFKDPRYTRPTTKFILQRLQERRFINPLIDISTLMKEEYFDGSKDVHQIFHDIIYALTAREIRGENIMNKDALLDDVLRGYPLEQEKNLFAQIAEYPKEIKENIANRIVMILLDKYIPDTNGITSLGFSNNFIWEPNNKLREMEMQLRMDDWRKLTNEMFGANWYFIPPQPSMLAKTLIAPMKAFYNLIHKAKALAKKLTFRENSESEVLLMAQKELETQVFEYSKMENDVQFVAMPKDKARQWVRMIISFAWLDVLKGENRYKPQDNAMAWLFVDKLRELLNKGEIKSLIHPEEIKELTTSVVLNREKLPAQFKKLIADESLMIRCQTALKGQQQ